MVKSAVFILNKVKILRIFPVLYAFSIAVLPLDVLSTPVGAKNDDSSSYCGIPFLF